MKLPNDACLGTLLRNFGTVVVAEDYVMPAEVHRGTTTAAQDLIFSAANSAHDSLAEQLERTLEQLRADMGKAILDYVLILGHIRTEPVCNPGSQRVIQLRFTQTARVVHHAVMSQTVKELGEPCVIYALGATL